MDGSALEFMEGIEKAGSTEQDVKRRFSNSENVSFEDKEKGVEMIIVPSEGDEFKVTVMVDYNSPVLGTQHARLDNLADFKKEIASCRTFVFLKRLTFRKTRSYQRWRRRQRRSTC